MSSCTQYDKAKITENARLVVHFQPLYASPYVRGVKALNVLKSIKSYIYPIFKSVGNAAFLKFPGTGFDELVSIGIRLIGISEINGNQYSAALARGVKKNKKIPSFTKQNLEKNGTDNDINMT